MGRLQDTHIIRKLVVYTYMVYIFCTSKKKTAKKLLFKVEKKVFDILLFKFEKIVCFFFVKT